VRRCPADAAAGGLRQGREPAAGAGSWSHRPRRLGRYGDLSACAAGGRVRGALVPGRPCLSPFAGAPPLAEGKEPRPERVAGMIGQILAARRAEATSLTRPLAHR